MSTMTYIVIKLSDHACGLSGTVLRHSAMAYQYGAVWFGKPDHPLMASILKKVISGFQKLTLCHAFLALCRAEIVRRLQVEDASSLFLFVDYSKIRTLTINCRNSVRILEYSKLPQTYAEKDLFGAAFEKLQAMSLICEKDKYNKAILGENFVGLGDSHLNPESRWL